MLSSALAELHSSEINRKLSLTDEEFLSWLRSKRQSKWFFSYYDIRKPYKRAFVLQRKGSATDVEGANADIFNRLESALADERGYKNVAHAVKVGLNIHGSVNRHDIVIDIPASMKKVSGINVLSEGHDKPDLISPIYSSIAEHFDNVARKARIYVRPDLLGGKTLIDSNILIRKELCNLYGLTS
jgi:hypothetical protein